ncbi:MAG: deoxyribodipyrimidine photo-lyase, partial [Bacteroidia bacterium]|nr:deoxyribodipyrimidine photo-lyase [Bacteroidia bacterium]
MTECSIFWFRRDLRLRDNHGLYKALSDKQAVLPLFIFDSEILEKLPEQDARVDFIYDTLQAMHERLKNDYDSGIEIRYGKPEDIFTDLIKKYSVEAVYTNHDYEPYARERDEQIGTLLSEHD